MFSFLLLASEVSAAPCDPSVTFDIADRYRACISRTDAGKDFCELPQTDENGDFDCIFKVTADPCTEEADLKQRYQCMPSLPDVACEVTIPCNGGEGPKVEVCYGNDCPTLESNLPFLKSLTVKDGEDNEIPFCDPAEWETLATSTKFCSDGFDIALQGSAAASACSSRSKEGVTCRLRRSVDYCNGVAITNCEPYPAAGSCIAPVGSCSESDELSGYYKYACFGQGCPTQAAAPEKDVTVIGWQDRKCSNYVVDKLQSHKDICAGRIKTKEFCEDETFTDDLGRPINCKLRAFDYGCTDEEDWSMRCVVDFPGEACSHTQSCPNGAADVEVCVGNNCAEPTTEIAVREVFKPTEAMFDGMPQCASPRSTLKNIQTCENAVDMSDCAFIGTRPGNDFECTWTSTMDACSGLPSEPHCTLDLDTTCLVERGECGDGDIRLACVGLGCPDELEIDEDLDEPAENWESNPCGVQSYRYRQHVDDCMELSASGCDADEWCTMKVQSDVCSGAVEWMCMPVAPGMACALEKKCEGDVTKLTCFGDNCPAIENDLPPVDTDVPDWEDSEGNKMSECGPSMHQKLSENASGMKACADAQDTCTERPECGLKNVIDSCNNEVITGKCGYTFSTVVTCLMKTSSCADDVNGGGSRWICVGPKCPSSLPGFDTIEYETKIISQIPALALLSESPTPVPTSEPTEESESPTLAPSPQPTVYVPGPFPIDYSKAVEKECKKMKSKHECDSLPWCQSKKKNGEFSKCKSKKCRKIKNMEHCYYAPGCERVAKKHRNKQRISCTKLSN